MYRIRTLDKIAAEGLALFDHKYQVGNDVGDPHGIIVRSSEVDTSSYRSLLAVSRAGAGVNNITVDKATEQGVCVFNTPGANANAVAELVFIMLGICARNIHQGIDFCRGLVGIPDREVALQVEAGKSRFRGFELAGKTLGVLGLGKIGLRVANQGIMQRMKVVGFDPFPALDNIHQLSSEVVMARSLQQMLGKADILSLHLPLNDKTRGMVNKDMLAGLPEGAVLVNYARGEIVEVDDVLELLDRGILACYVTDFPESRLLGHPRVICSPHLGASTEESEEHCAAMAVSELKSYLEYGIVSRSVNFPTAETIPSDSVHTRLIMINRDIPDMIGFASHLIGESNINIVSYLNESNGRIGYNIIDLAKDIPDDILARIEDHPGVIRTRTILFKQ